MLSHRTTDTAMNRLAIAFATILPIAAIAAPTGFPASVNIPSLNNVGEAPNVETYGQWEFTLRDKTQVVRGKSWDKYVPFPKPYADEKLALPPLVDDLKKAGWEVLLYDLPRNPPLATLRLARDGKETWLHVEPAGNEVHLVAVERGNPTGNLSLPAPTEGIQKVAQNADFPFLKRFPGTQLTGTLREDQPFLVNVEPDKEAVQVASGYVRKDYQAKKDTGRIDVVISYRDALKAAGWTIVEENTAVTTGDPNLTAHYAKPPVDLWAHVHAGGPEYYLAVADAGGERAPDKLKAEIDRACKVAIYGLNFDFDKATLREDSAPALESILKVLTSYPDLRAELGGHTDNVGKRDYNTKLSEARVNTVRGWLVGKGVKADRLTARGYADTQPVADNDSAQGRAKNRRVELRKVDCSPR